MVIFHSYVKLPEGKNKATYLWVSPPNNKNNQPRGVWKKKGPSENVGLYIRFLI